MIKFLKKLYIKMKYNTIALSLGEKDILFIRVNAPIEKCLNLQTKLREYLKMDNIIFHNTEFDFKVIKRK